MSDSGNSEESKRLSDLDAIAEALRAGELDTATRFSRKRADSEADEEITEGRSPADILQEAQSEDEDTIARRDAKEVWTHSGGKITVETVPQGRADVVIEPKDHSMTISDIVTLISEIISFSDADGSSCIVKVMNGKEGAADWYQLEKVEAGMYRRKRLSEEEIEELSQMDEAPEQVESADS